MSWSHVLVDILRSINFPQVVFPDPHASCHLRNPVMVAPTHNQCRVGIGQSHTGSCQSCSCTPASAIEEDNPCPSSPVHRNCMLTNLFSECFDARLLSSYVSGLPSSTFNYFAFGFLDTAYLQRACYTISRSTKATTRRIGRREAPYCLVWTSRHLIANSSLRGHAASELLTEEKPSATQSKQIDQLGQLFTCLPARAHRSCTSSPGRSYSCCFIISTSVRRQSSNVNLHVSRLSRCKVMSSARSD